MNTIIQKENSGAPATDARGVLAEIEKSIENESRFEPYSLADLYEKEFPEARWLVQDLIPFGGITAVTGGPASFKSFATQSLAASVAFGKPFLEHFETTKGKVLIVDEENGGRLIRERFKAMGVPSSPDIMFLADIGVKVDNEDHIEKLLEIVEREKPALIVFDSLVRLHSKEENIANEMAGVFSAFKKLLADDRAIVFLHHHRKPSVTGQGGSVGNSIRGSTDILAAVHSHLALDRKRKEQGFTIEQGKIRSQRETARFLVAVLMNAEGNLYLSYQGEDDFEAEEMLVTGEAIMAILSESAEPVSTPTFVEKTGKARRSVDDTLRELVRTQKIKRLDKRGPRGAHLYVLPDTEKTEEEMNMSDLPRAVIINEPKQN